MREGESSLEVVLVHDVVVLDKHTSTGSESVATSQWQHVACTTPQSAAQPSIFFSGMPSIAMNLESSSLCHILSTMPCQVPRKHLEVYLLCTFILHYLAKCHVLGTYLEGAHCTYASHQGPDGTYLLLQET
jgi:hypothetical protein